MSAWRVQRSGVAIERYWWIRASTIGCVNVSLPFAGVGSSGRLAVGDSVRVAGEHVADLVVGEAGDARGAQRDQERRGLLAVGEVRGVEHLLGRDLAEEVEQVDRAPGGGVEEDAGLAGEVVASAPPRSAIPAWARISCASGYSSTRWARSAAIGGSPRPAWIRIGTRRSAARANTGASRSSFRRNRCARGWSLIPRAPRSRQRSASSIGLLAEVEPDERDQSAFGALRELERAVVRLHGRPGAGRARPCRT